MSSSPSARGWIAVLTLGACCCASPPPAPASAGANDGGMGGGGEPASATAPMEVEELVVQVLATRPHDPRAFTQGLVFDGEHLLESTGQFGRSELRRVDPASGEVLQRVALSPDHFGEGLARIPRPGRPGGDRLIQLTWLAGRALEWSADRFEARAGFDYEGEGWGLCFDGDSLVMSDGSASLAFRDVESFEPVRQTTVTLNGNPVRGLNELECVDGAVWANVLGSPAIVRIDPESGGVTAVVDAGGLLTAQEEGAADVLNGIAWNPERKIFYITGKHWPKLFEVRFVPRPPGTRGLLGGTR